MDDIPNTTRFPLQPCPFCGTKVDAATSTHGPSPAPRDGDFMLCVGCAQPAVFTVTPFGPSLVKPTPEQMAQFAVDYGHVADVLRRTLDEQR